MYIPDGDEARRVSVEGRLAMFDDAIEKLLWNDKRGRSPSGEGGLRDPTPQVWRGQDPGWIFRTDLESELRIPRGHLRHLVTGVLPGFLPAALCPAALGLLDHPWIMPLVLALICAGLIRWAPTLYFYALALASVGLFVAIPLAGLEYLLPWPVWLLPIALLLAAILWIWFGPRLDKRAGNPTTGSWTNRVRAWTAIGINAVFMIGLGIMLWGGREFVDGRLGDLRVGPLPKGIPVNSLMNLDPDASLLKLIAAVRGLVTTVGKLRADDKLPVGQRLHDRQRLAIFEKEAGPALMVASKCTDFILDRGHYFGESLSDEEKTALIAFLKTL